MLFLYIKIAVAMNWGVKNRCIYWRKLIACVLFRPIFERLNNRLILAKCDLIVSNWSPPSESRSSSCCKGILYWYRSLRRNETFVEKSAAVFKYRWLTTIIWVIWPSRFWLLLDKSNIFSTASLRKRCLIISKTLLILWDFLFSGLSLFHYFYCWYSLT